MQHAVSQGDPEEVEHEPPQQSASFRFKDRLEHGEQGHLSSSLIPCDLNLMAVIT